MTQAVIKDKLYPAKVWGLTIIAASFIFMLYDFSDWEMDKGIGSFLGEWFTLMSVNLLLGLPILFVFFLVFNIVNQTKKSIIRKRILLVSTAFALFLFTWISINTMFRRFVLLSSKSIFLYIDFLACIILTDYIFTKGERQEIK